MILSYQFMAIFIVTLTRNLRLAISIASAYTMLALTYAGLTFPLFGMPVIAQVISKIFSVYPLAQSIHRTDSKRRTDIIRIYPADIGSSLRVCPVNRLSQWVNGKILLITKQ